MINAARLPSIGVSPRKDRKAILKHRQRSGTGSNPRAAASEIKHRRRAGYRTKLL
jgi:hypothetical protein